MRSFRFFPIFLTIGAVEALGLLTGALKMKGSTDPEPRPMERLPADNLDAAAPDAEAAAELEKALAGLAVQWLETAIRQKVRLPGLVYEAEGRYLLAPGHRFRLELTRQTGGAQGAMLMVSDGTTLWQAQRANSPNWESVKRLRLGEVLAKLNGPSGSPQVRAVSWRGPSFNGVEPLLRNLQGTQHWVRREALPGTNEVRLTGVWPPARQAALMPRGEAWPEGLPRRCRLILSANHWPRRVEWWGPFEGQEGNVLLAQLELRDPLLDRAMPENRCAREFSFEPGKAPITDSTAPLTAELSARAAALAGPR